MEMEIPETENNTVHYGMFVLCNYADAKGIGTGGTFGSWQTLKYWRGK